MFLVQMVVIMKISRLIPFLLAVLCAAPVYAMGAFFRAPSSRLFSKIMTGLQWGYFVHEAVKRSHEIKEVYDTDECVLESSGSYWKDEEASKYVQKLFRDNSVQVVREKSTNGFAYYNPYTGTKCIILPYEDVPLGVVFHEYEHLKRKHQMKVDAFKVLIPLCLAGMFKGVHYGYKVARYGYKVVQKKASPVSSALFKIPSAYGMQEGAKYASSPLLAAYSRSHEWEADAAVPADLAQGLAYYLSHFSEDPMPAWLSIHPPLQDRIAALRARATRAERKSEQVSEDQKL